MFRKNNVEAERPGDFGGTSFDLIGADDPDAWMVSDAAVEAYPEVPSAQAEADIVSIDTNLEP